MDVIAPLRHGIAPHLEAEADRLIKESLAGVTRYRDKDDILTPWKEQMRHSREVFNVTGVAEPQLRRGMYDRAYNPDKPDLNSIDGAAAPRRRGFSDSLSEHVEASRAPYTPMDDLWR